MQYQTYPRLPAQKPVAIEIDGEPLGVVVPAEDGYRFLAVRLSAFALDGHTFDSIEAAELALGAAIHAEQRS
jgi:hypothetical protein